eukprot:CAMPEP_0180528400 /NCGR_PEP_ID=MMETSP1036_2-20121128/60768_1 /TAXON_ID=632150 /ORGANISM="Azadinium spinosum, Strain 3D9" /LENGTH=131 /DNA_ID=CAMNT_0022541937 /DNA_START=9 /DNA_END=401 /DNA_ORIENTATION=-
MNSRRGYRRAGGIASDYRRQWRLRRGHGPGFLEYRHVSQAATLEGAGLPPMRGRRRNSGLVAAATVVTVAAFATTPDAIPSIRMGILLRILKLQLRRQPRRCMSKGLRWTPAATAGANVVAPIHAHGGTIP